MGREQYDGSNPFRLLRPLHMVGGVRVATITGNETLTGKSSQYQALNGGTSNRTITLPAFVDGGWFWIENTGTTNNIAISDGSNIAVLAPGGWALVVSEGTDWTVAAEAQQPGEITDPGNAGAIPARAGDCQLVTAGAETRTLADPVKVGMLLHLRLLTDGGDGVVTAASPVNATGNNTLTFAEAGDSIILLSTRDAASAYCWRVVVNDGVALSTV